MTTVRHICEIEHDHPPLMPLGGFRARCACGWGSDCYAQYSDARRAGEVHERRASRLDFDELIDRSSIGAAIRDIAERGIDAHADDLARRMSHFGRSAAARRGSPKPRPAKGRARKASPPAPISPKPAADRPPSRRPR